MVYDKLWQNVSDSCKYQDYQLSFVGLRLHAQASAWQSNEQK